MMTHAELFMAIDNLFTTEESLARVRAFCSSQCQIEGWFKGELILLFSNLRRENQIEDWQPEHRSEHIGNGRIDFFLNLEDGPLYLELKTFYHGQQRGANIDLGTCFYFLSADIDKLADIPNGNRYSIVFVTPRPDEQHWSYAFSKFQRKHPYVTEESTLADYPQEVFVAKLRVQLGGNGI